MEKLNLVWAVLLWGISYICLVNHHYRGHGWRNTMFFVGYALFATAGALAFIGFLSNGWGPF